MRISIGGYVNGPVAGRKQLNVLVSPKDWELDSLLTEFSKVGTGILAAAKDPVPSSGPAKLSIYAENYRYLLMLEDYSLAGDCQVRMLNNSLVTGLSVMLGELYPACAITGDFSQVSEIIRSFMKYGDVSYSVLTE